MEKIEPKVVNANIFSLRFWLGSTDHVYLKTTFDRLLKQAQFRVLQFSDHHFPDKGYTALWLLAESHLAVHSFPGENCTYIELSGCNRKKTQSFEQACLTLSFPIEWVGEGVNESIPKKQNNSKRQ